MKANCFLIVPGFTKNAPSWSTAVLFISLAAFGAQFRALYESNQNTKFLHAFAQSGVGFLHEDWTAQTKDGLPAFTAIVKLILSSIGEPGFYFAAFVTYVGFGICAVLLHLRLTRDVPLQRWNIFIFVAMVCVFSAVSALKTTAFDGFGDQYILNGYFQPSDFGILLIFSILAFSGARFVIATLSAVVAAVVHPAYVVPSAVLLVIYFAFEVGAMKKARSRNGWIKLSVFSLGIAALLAVALIIQNMFPPTSVADYREANRLLVEFRIPHHANPWNWNFYAVSLKAIICFVAIALLPRGRLRFVVTTAALAMFAFLLVGLLPSLNIYKLIAPWRLSVAVIPLSTLICLSIVATKGAFFLQKHGANAYRLISLIAAAIIATTIISGAMRSSRLIGKPFPVYRDFVRSHLESGQQYLTPPSNLNFRLLTGAPQYVSHKTHPYQDVEVLEWYRRLQRAEAFFRAPTFDCQDLKRFATEERVTHVITSQDHINSSCTFAHVVFENSGLVILQFDPRSNWN